MQEKLLFFKLVYVQKCHLLCILLSCWPSMGSPWHMNVRGDVASASSWDHILSTSFLDFVFSVLSLEKLHVSGSDCAVVEEHFMVLASEVFT